jgi:hypothetical protein
MNIFLKMLIVQRNAHGAFIPQDNYFSLVLFVVKE